MIRLRAYTEEREEGGHCIMQDWWINVINATPGYYINDFRVTVEAWGGTIPEDFLAMRDEECYIEFEDERKAALFLLRWS